MATKADKDRKDAKAKAVAEHIKQASSAIDTLAGMWDERTLDVLILAFGIGTVELNIECGENEHN